jgi:hypothetical protein
MLSQIAPLCLEIRLPHFLKFIKLRLSPTLALKCFLGLIFNAQMVGW